MSMDSQDWFCSYCVLSELPFFDSDPPLGDSNYCCNDILAPNSTLPVDNTTGDDDDSLSLRHVMNKHRKGYVFCHLNVRSLPKCVDEIQDLVSVDGHDRLFLSRSETWLDCGVPDGLISIPGHIGSLEETDVVMVEG